MAIKKCLIKYLFFFIFYMLSMSFVYSATLNINITRPYNQPTVTALGSNNQVKLTMLQIGLSTTEGSATLSEFRITNNGTLPFATQSAPHGVTRVELQNENMEVIKYKDLNGLLSASEVIFDNLTIDVSDEESQTIYVVYEIDNNAINLAKTVKAGIYGCQADDTIMLENNIDASIEISGGIINYGEDISPKYLFIGEEELNPTPMLKVSIDLLGEPMQEIEITIANEGSNFSSQLLESVSIYQDSNDGIIGEYDQADPLKQIISSFYTSTNITFTITSENYMATGNYVFYIFYAPDDDATIGSIVKSQITAVTLTGRTSGQTVSALGTLPVPISPAEVQIIDNYNLELKDLFSLVASKIYQGSYKVPILEFTLTSFCSSLSLVDITIKNDGHCRFSPYADGITKVWLYKDNSNLGTIGAFDSRDILIKKSSQFNNAAQNVILENIKLLQNKEETYFLLYDIGLLATSTFNATIYNITATTDIYIAEDFPCELTSSQNISAIPVYISAIESNISTIETITTEDIFITMNVVNTGNTTFSINYATPKFYQNNINGLDISSEYSLIPLQNYPIQIGQGTSSLGFILSTQNIYTQGNIVLDGLVSLITDNVNIILSRYQVDENQYHAISSDNILAMDIRLSQESDDWDYPKHILAVNIATGINTKNFESGDPAVPGSILQIYLDKDSIDESSLQASFSNITCTQVSDPNNIWEFNYNYETGLFLSKAPPYSGIFELSITDKAGNQLDPLSLDFNVSDKITIEDFLLYPNPFNPNENNPLVFSFKLNKEANVEIYIINSHGQIIKQESQYFSDIGYKEYNQWDGKTDNGNYIASGIYSVRIIAEDTNGNKAYAKTKLAVK